jgi:hypothetical protein
LLRSSWMRYAYIAPLYNQAKTVVWDVVKQFTRPVLASAPNEAELRVDLLGGSRISYGGDNGDRLAGSVSTGSCRHTTIVVPSSRETGPGRPWWLCGHHYLPRCRGFPHQKGPVLRR